MDAIGETLLTDPATPLVNRAAQGAYPPGSSLDPLLGALFEGQSPPDEARRAAIFRELGFYSAPKLNLPVGEASSANATLRISPLQFARAASILSNGGVLPAPRIALAVDTPAQGWVILPSEEEPLQFTEEANARQAAESLAVPENPFWEFNGLAQEDGKSFTWFAAGTMPGWQGAPLTLVILLEEKNAPLAKAIGESLLRSALESH
jgi:hypothetical protein